MSAPDRLTVALADRYRIERELGAGGMATVYLAEDLKHKRKVALKVLKPELAAVLGAERFVVEITTTAALSHPHILPLFDSGEADGFLFYVMPFVDGETLRDKLNRETQLSVEEAVRITREVADALHYAHGQGVIHRDIKPENILLQGGRPMVADFGIALAVSAAAGGRMTETGLSLGTPHYMSPEQATAEKEITGRSDIYSLASVCYEMLAGQPPHLGGSAQQIIMKIIAEPVEAVTRYRKAVPANVAAAVGKALEKLPADRFESAEKFAEALANPAFATIAHGAGVAQLLPPLRDRRLLVTAGAAAILFVAALAGWFRAEQAPPVHRYLLVTPGTDILQMGAPTPVAAPDGSFIIYFGPAPESPATPSLWVKRREDVAGTPIRGTSGATAFALSPDAQEVAFSVGGLLRIIPVSGGVSRTVVQQGAFNGGIAWLDDGSLVFSAVDASRPNGFDLFIVPAAGGEPRSLGLAGTAQVAVLPNPVLGRRAVLYARCSGLAACDLRAFDIDDSTDVLVASGAWVGVHTTTGHVVYAQAGALVARAFDAGSLTPSGPQLGLVDEVLPREGSTTFSLSRNGTLIYLPIESGTSGLQHELVWVDRSGAPKPVDPSWPPFQLTSTGNNHGWALSPDGRQLAIGLRTEAGEDIWIKQMPGGALTRLNSSDLMSWRPRWMPDGVSVLYLSGGSIRTRRADGVGGETTLGNDGATEALVSPDGEWLIVRLQNAPTSSGRDIFGRRLTGTDTALVPILAARHDEMSGSLSPDGRWLMYVSNETGRNEVYVRPFPDWNRLRVAVSIAGGEAPLWSRDGREIFYLSADNAMMAVRFTPASTPTLAAPVTLFPVLPELRTVETAFYTPWDIAADGRFLMARRVGAGSAASYPIVMENFLTLLRERAGR